VVLSAEIENMGQSIAHSPPGELGTEATKAGGWVSGEEFYTYVQPGPKDWLFVIFFLELLSTTFQFPVLDQRELLLLCDSPYKVGLQLCSSHPHTILLSLPCRHPVPYTHISAPLVSLKSCTGSQREFCSWRLF
jgi:hypothetical protein